MKARMLTPEVERAEAIFTADVYRAERRVLRRLSGRLPDREPTAAEWAIYRRARARIADKAR